MFATPSGSPASCSSSNSLIVVRGVISLGLATIVLPASRAGAIFQDTCSSG
jgi:hypothetical protein